MKRLLIFSLLVLSCGRLSVKPAPPSSPEDDQVEQLGLEYERELGLYNRDTLTAYGLPSRSDCDTALWAGEACAGGANVAIDQLEYSPGEIHRRPVPACWDGTDQGAQTTISRDNLTGYMACLWARQDLEGLRRLAAYGEAHAFVMGKPIADGRTILGVNLTGLLGRMIYSLSGGQDDRAYALAFEAYAPVFEDYEQHVQAVGITLQGEVAASIREQGLPLDISAIALTDISPGMKSRLEELVAAHPEDYLFQAALGVYTGDFSRAVTLLLEHPPAPSYVRGDQPELFERARWLYSARLVLKHMKKDQAQ